MMEVEEAVDRLVRSSLEEAEEAGHLCEGVESLVQYWPDEGEFCGEWSGPSRTNGDDRKMQVLESGSEGADLFSLEELPAINPLFC